MQEILGDYEGFVRRIINALDNDGIDVSRLELDHICYRVESSDEYDSMRVKLDPLGELLTESEVGGRPISTYKLYEPVVVDGREIALIELPSPKPGSPYPGGLEHAEFVIDESLESFIERHPGVNFVTRALGKEINPDVQIMYDGFSVKFHQQSLEDVIAYEKSLGKSRNNGK